MMNRLLTILLLLGATAHGQINNPPTSVNIVDSTATGRAVLTATNAAAAATAIGLGTTNDVQFNKALSQSSVIGGGADAFLHIVTPQQGEIQIGWGSGDFEMDELALTLEQADWKFYKPFSVPNATNRAIIRTNLELGAANNVEFRRLKMIAANASDNGDDATLWLDTSGTNKAATMRLSGTGGSAEKYNAYLQGTSSGLQVSAGGGFRVLSGPTAGVGSVLFAVNSSGNATLNGTANLAPSQTADSGSSLMTRDLSDDRYSFSQWYDANDLLSGAQNVGVNPLITGNGSGHVAGAILVTVSNIATKFMLPVDYRVSGEVKVVSYWTDRTLTNGGTNGDIAVWAFPFVVQPTTDTTTSGVVNGTRIENTFTANYGGSGDSRFYVMEQTLNFATVTGISATNPMQLKWVEFQRRGNDASDTSNDNIYLSGVHIYVP
jgi:hypothetical protein